MPGPLVGPISHTPGSDLSATGRTSLCEHLFHAYDRAVHHYLVRMVGDHAAAEDLKQETFLRVLVSKPEAKEATGPLKPWLFAIARNAAIDHLRTRGRAEPTDPATLELHLDGHARWNLSDHTHARLYALLHQLPPAQKQALLLRYHGDLSHAEIARATGRTADAVRHLEHRAMVWLRTQLAARALSTNVGVP